MSFQGDFELSKYGVHHCFFAGDSKIFPLQDPSQLTLTKLEKIWMLDTRLKLFSNLIFAGSSLRNKAEFFL